MRFALTLEKRSTPTQETTCLGGGYPRCFGKHVLLSEPLGIASSVGDLPPLSKEATFWPRWFVVYT